MSEKFRGMVAGRADHSQTPFCPIALFPQGNKAVTITTSPNKKRRLSPPETAENPSNPQESSSPSQVVVSEQTSKVTSSPSPPRYIPPYLVLEGARSGRSPTPEPSNTTASSPSGAYAGLTIDSDGYNSGTDTAGTNKRRGSLTSSGLRGGAYPPIRSASPAKRRASVMANEDVDMAEVQTSGPASGSEATTAPTNLGAVPRRKSKSQGSHHVREKSVDMLAQDADPQSGTSSTSSTTGGDVSGASSASSTATADIPPIDDQINQVMHLAQQDSMKEGLKGYVVASKWLSRVLARGSEAAGNDKYGKGAREGLIGPVDNTGINLVVDPTTGGYKDEAGEDFVPLKPGLQMADDFEVLPPTAWDLIIKWYGLAKWSPVIRRYCHNTSTSETQENLQWELHPPVFTILKLPHYEGTTSKVLKEKDAIPVKILASRAELYQKFLKRAKEDAGIELKTKVRVWRILGGLGGSSRGGMMTPAQSRSNSPAPGAVASVDPGNRLVIDVNTFAGLQLGSQRELLEAKDETANDKYNGHSRLDIVGLRQDEVIVLEEQIGGPGGGEWVSDVSTTKGKSNGVPISVTKSGATTIQSSGLKPNASVNSRGTSPAPGGMMTRGRQAKNGRTRGTVGLNNLGNTCYMNSALQCVRSVQELTRYFLEDKYKVELNPGNPLAHNGNVAKSYAQLLHEMYSPNSLNSFAPRNFKNIIGKYGPSFSGYQQQDSQEFLLFLLDGLQEDLNRITKKPYIEKPDSTDEMVNDPVALQEMADRCWDIYKQRNDSVITDLFAGMYKSTVVCPTCDKVSIIFDPFNNLTLQLPIESVWNRSVFYFPLHSKPVVVAVDIDKNASFMALKEYIASKFPGADAKKMVIAEIYKNKFYKIFDDRNSISEEHIAESDSIGVYELEDKPTNYPQPKKTHKPKAFFTYSYGNSDEEPIPEGDSPLAEKMLVAVFNRKNKDSSSKYQQKALFAAPSLIVVNREEARDYDAILRKALACAETMSTRDFLREADEFEGHGPDSTTEDSDTVLMNEDEADSSTESKVQAKSLESEDGMIDISMGDNEESEKGKDSKANSIAPMLRPGKFITPEVRNLFEMKYLPSNGTEMIPIGLSPLSDESKNYPTIASRQPAEPAAKSRPKASEQLRKRLAKVGNGSPPTSDEDEDDALPPTQPQVQDQSDDEDDGLPPVSVLTKPKTGFGKNSAAKQKRERSKTPVDDGPLLRLGDSIILDWTNETYNALFSGRRKEEDDMRGAPTWDEIPTHPDPELEEKRSIRSSRRRNGVTLGDCLDEFGKPEILSENDAWYCPRCKEHRRASKTFELWKAPDILVVHLKRFSAQGRFRDKLDVLVEFPIEGLDLSSRVAMQEEGKSPIYDLFAVDNHYGGLGGGHYTAYAQSFWGGDKTWFEYNDSSVMRRPDPKVVVTSAAYLLFYRRRSSEPLGGPFFEKLIAEADNVPSGSQPPSRPTSRGPSPSGEGKRLDDSSRNGSSSALRGVGAAHQAGGGGSAEGTARTRTGVDDELPAYSTLDPRNLQENTLESMEMDGEEDEGIAGMHGPFPNNLYPRNPQWSFDRLSSGDYGVGETQVIAAPPASEGEDEDLFAENSSTKVANSSISDSGENRMADFGDDEGTTSGAFETPPGGTTPLLDVPPIPDEEDGPVAEVMIEDIEGDYDGP